MPVIRLVSSGDGSLMTTLAGTSASAADKPTRMFIPTSPSPIRCWPVISTAVSNTLDSHSPVTSSGLTPGTVADVMPPLVHRRGTVGSAMYRFLLRPKWIVFHIAVFAAAIGMLGLARWQWNKHLDR